MSLAITTTLDGPVDVSVSQLQQAFAGGAYNAAQLKTFAESLIHWTDVFGFRTLLVASQIGHETGWFRFGNLVHPDQYNFAGLGATGPGFPGAAFPTIDAGVLAVCAHHAVYHWGPKANWPEHLRQYASADPRYSAVLQAHPVVRIKVLGDYRGTWAVPGTTYPERIVDASKRITQYPREEPPMATPPAGWKPPQVIRSIIEFDASNRPHQRLNGGSWDFITTHNTGNPSPGANAAMHAAWMHNLGKAGAEEPSWHYTVDESAIYQHMEDDWAGWHASDDNGPGNFDSLGIELVEIGNLTLTIWNAAWLVAKKMRERGKADIGATVKQHNHFARDGKNCPRLLRANNGARWNEYLAAIAYFLHENAQPEPAPTPDKLILPGQGSESPDVFPPDAGLQRGFKGVYLALGAAKYPDDPALGILTLTGWAKDVEEWEGIDGCVYQRFHRVTLQYDPRNAEPWDIVQMHPDTPLPERKVA